MRQRQKLAVALLVMGIAAALTLVAAMSGAASEQAASTADATRATAKFHDLSVAEEAGYSLLRDKRGIACIAMSAMPGMPAGAMGVHWANGSLVGDGNIVATKPEALVYAPVNGTLRLAALEYVVLKSAWDAHHSGAPVLFGHEFNFTPAGNRFGLPAYYSLHAWVWKHNPAGEFSMWNPKVTCK